MASIDVLNAKMTAQLQVSKECLRPTWMYFTMYYPGANSGNIVQETGIEYGNQLPDQNYRATTTMTTKPDDDDTYDNIKVLVVHINMGEIQSALTAVDSYSAVYSVFRNSILDTEALTGRKNTLCANEYSFRFVFYALAHLRPSQHIRMLLIARWALFSNMHNWRPKAGIEGIKQCIVVPMEDHMSEWLANGGSDKRFNREIKSLLEDNPSEYISPHSIKRRFWLEEAYSSHLWLYNQIAQQSPTSSIARLEIFDSVSPLCVQIADWKARRSVQNAEHTPPASPASPASPVASDYQTARSRQSQTDSSPDDRSRTRSSSPTPILQRMQCNRCSFRSAYKSRFLNHLKRCKTEPGDFDDRLARRYVGEKLIVAMEES